MSNKPAQLETISLFLTWQFIQELLKKDDSNCEWKGLIHAPARRRPPDGISIQIEPRSSLGARDEAFFSLGWTQICPGSWEKVEILTYSLFI